MKLRIKFTKFGVVKFIGHLDMMRYFQKAIRRASIDVAYSGGYSPHQIMSFAAPLGVGLESEGEYFDLEVHAMESPEALQAALNAVMVEGINILSVRILPETAGNAMASVAAAKYRICFRKGQEPAFDWQQRLAEFTEQPSIPYLKKTKKGEKELDLKKYVYEIQAVEDTILVLVNASSSGNIKPAMIMEAFFAQNGQVLGEFDLEITRLETYGNSGSEESPQFMPLDRNSNDEM